MKSDKIKRRIKKRIKRHALIFVLIQIVIFQFFVPSLLRQFPPITLEDTKRAVIVVEEVNFEEVYHRTYRLEIKSSGLTYRFPLDCSDDEYSIYELRDTISIGEVIEIRYIEYQIAFGKRLDIVDARADSKVYRIFDVYKHRRESAFYFGLILFLIIEVVYILILYKVLSIEGVVFDVKKLLSKSLTRKKL